MKLIGVTKTEMKRIISAYTEIVDRLRMGIPTSVFSKIVYTDNKPKVEALKKFVSK
jgi:hypothetical protein